MKLASLAGTSRDYAALQGRVEGNQLKIQGAGPAVNRDYGLSITITIPSDLAAWMKGIPVSIKSLAHTEKRYFAMQAAELDFEAGKVRVQVAGPKLNRSYGAVFSVADADLADFVEQVLAEDEDEEDDEEIEEEEAVVDYAVVELI